MPSDVHYPRENVLRTSYSVVGLTCAHCAAAVTSELSSVPGVDDVLVDLVAGGVSTVTVSSSAALTSQQVREALDEAGDYQLVDAG